MTKRQKQKKEKSSIPQLCTAVKRVREAFGDSQERFGRRLDLSLMTISKFELGKQVPRDRPVLFNLAKAAHEVGLAQEGNLFEQSAQSAPLSRRVTERELSHWITRLNYVSDTLGHTLKPDAVLNREHIQQLMGSLLGMVEAITDEIELHLPSGRHAQEAPEMNEFRELMRERGITSVGCGPEGTVIHRGDDVLVSTRSDIRQEFVDRAKLYHRGGNKKAKAGSLGDSEVQRREAQADVLTSKES